MKEEVKLIKKCIKEYLNDGEFTHDEFYSITDAMKKIESSLLDSKQPIGGDYEEDQQPENKYGRKQ